VRRAALVGAALLLCACAPATRSGGGTQPVVTERRFRQQSVLRVVTAGRASY
jgi:hypothetical protein